MRHGVPQVDYKPAGMSFDIVQSGKVLDLLCVRSGDLDLGWENLASCEFSTYSDNNIVLDRFFGVAMPRSVSFEHRVLADQCFGSSVDAAVNETGRPLRDIMISGQ